MKQEFYNFLPYPAIVWYLKTCVINRLLSDALHLMFVNTMKIDDRPQY